MSGFELSAGDELRNLPLARGEELPFVAGSRRPCDRIMLAQRHRYGRR